jgi:hypothetical protein
LGDASRQSTQPQERKDDCRDIYTGPLSDPYFDMKEVRIANLSASMKEMTAPRFSPEGKTIYFVGVHVVDPPEGADASPYDVRAIYSVPTEGGEATRIPIDRVNSDGIPIHIGTFALSHDWSKFTINGGDGIFTVTLGGGAPTRVNKDSWYWSTLQQSIPQPPPDSHRWDRPCVGQPGWGGYGVYFARNTKN